MLNAPVAVTADREARAVDVAVAVELVDHRDEIVLQVGDVVVVHPPRLADDRRIEVGDGVALRHQILDGAGTGAGERLDVLRAECAVVARLVGVLVRVEPEHGREPRPFLVILREGEVDQEVIAVGPGHHDPLADGVRELGRVVDVVRELGDLPAPHVAQIRIRHRRRRLALDDRLREVIVERRLDGLEQIAGALEERRLLPRLDLDAIDEAARRMLLPVPIVVRALEVRVLAVR